MWLCVVVCGWWCLFSLHEALLGTEAVTNMLCAVRQHILLLVHSPSQPIHMHCFLPVVTILCCAGLCYIVSRHALSCCAVLCAMSNTTTGMGMMGQGMMNPGGWVLKVSCLLRQWGGGLEHATHTTPQLHKSAAALVGAAPPVSASASHSHCCRSIAAAAAAVDCCHCPSFCCCHCGVLTRVSACQA